MEAQTKKNELCGGLFGVCPLDFHSLSILWYKEVYKTLTFK